MCTYVTSVSTQTNQASSFRMVAGYNGDLRLPNNHGETENYGINGGLQFCCDLLKPSKSHFQLFEKNAKETNVAALSMCDCKLIH